MTQFAEMVIFIKLKRKRKEEEQRPRTVSVNTAFRRTIRIEENYNEGYFQGSPILLFGRRQQVSPTQNWRGSTGNLIF